jgi:hypothetical protein
MNIRSFFIVCFLSFGFLGQGIAQELDVKVVFQTAPGVRFLSDKSLFNVISKSIEDLFNGTKWGDDIFRPHEKIRGTVTFTLKGEPQIGFFEAEMLVQFQRPVFNSNYESLVLSVLDRNVSFVFNENTLNLNKTNNNFTDNLSAIISFYSYMALAMDFDTFKVNGGDIYYKKAQEIILSLPSGVASEQGWRNDKTFGTNRFWLLENLQNPIFRQFRQSFYEYHRLGLDKMYDDPDKSRAVILSALTSIGQANLEYPNSYVIEAFCNTKNLEIVEIFKIADKGQKDKLKNIMIGLDIQRRGMYEKI